MRAVPPEGATRFAVVPSPVKTKSKVTTACRSPAARVPSAPSVTVTVMGSVWDPEIVGT